MDWLTMVPMILLSVAMAVGLFFQLWVIAGKLSDIEDYLDEWRKDNSAFHAAISMRVTKLEQTVDALVAIEKARAHKKKNPGLAAS